MRALLAMLWLVSGVAFSAQAQDDPGKHSFDAGVAAAEAQQWEDARRHFEASLAHADRPATRFNLLLLCDVLQDPLDVTRHALAFLSFPDRPEHAEERARALELLARSSAQLAVLTVESLPPAFALSIDGAKPALRDGQRLYVVPGMHRLAARRPDGSSESSLIQLVAGQVAAWPRMLEPVPLPQAVSAPPQRASDVHAAGTRTHVAWTLGSMGAATQLSALGMYWGAEHRAGELDLTKPGVEDASSRYQRLQNTVVPLAIVGGALMAAAVAVGARAVRRGSRGHALAALIVASSMAGVGLVLALREPRDVPDTNLPESTRQAGGLLAASALPLFAYGIGALSVRRRQRTDWTRRNLLMGFF